jgi:hypothetical protein
MIVILYLKPTDSCFRRRHAPILGKVSPERFFIAPGLEELFGSSVQKKGE